MRPESTSLRRRYELFREHDIEFYKQVVHPRTLIQLAEMARRRMDTRGDLFLGDLTLAFEVDALVADRLRLPSFRAWSGRQFRSLGTRRTWSDHAQQLALQLPTSASAGAVLLLQPRAGDVWEAVCASGRRVPVVDGLLGGRIAAPRSVLRRSYAS